MEQVKIKVAGMSCMMCVKHVKKALNQQKEVASVDVDLAAGIVTLELVSPLSDDRLTEIIDDAGYTFKGRI